MNARAGGEAPGGAGTDQAGAGVRRRIDQLVYMVEQRGGCVAVPASTLYVLMRLAALPIPPGLDRLGRGALEEEVADYLRSDSTLSLPEGAKP